MKKIDFILIVLIAFFSLGCLFLLNKQTPIAQASECKHLNAECQINNSDKTCCGDLVCMPFNEESGNGKCGFKPTPTLTPTPTKTPKVTCTPTPTITPTPTLTPTPTQGCNPDEEDCTTPTPSVSPEPSTSPTSGNGQGNTPSGDNHTYSPDTCNGIKPDAPILQGYTFKSPTEVVWNWWKSLTQGITAQWLEYGYSKDNLPYGKIVDVNDSSTPTANLDPNQKVHWARVCVVANNCETCSEPFDPVYK